MAKFNYFLEFIYFGLNDLLNTFYLHLVLKIYLEIYFDNFMNVYNVLGLYSSPILSYTSLIPHSPHHFPSYLTSPHLCL